MKLWLYRLFFGQSAAIADLQARLQHQIEQNAQLRLELQQKCDEMHALLDAILIDHGRSPMYSTPEAPQRPPQPQETPLGQLRAREWHKVATALSLSAEDRANGGVK